MSILKSGEIKHGIIVSIDNSGLVVDVGTKYTCYIRRENLSKDPYEYKVGDNIKAVVFRINDMDGIAELGDYDVYGKLRPGIKVKGIIVAIDISKVTVYLGTEFSGYCKLQDLIIDTQKKPSDILSIGNELDFIIISVDYVNKTIQLKIEDLDKQQYHKHNSSLANEVMSQVQEKLTQMKPALISEIAISVYSQLEKGLAAENAELKNKVSELEQRIKHLESLVDKMKL